MVLILDNGRLTSQIQPVIRNHVRIVDVSWLCMDFHIKDVADQLQDGHGVLYRVSCLAPTQVLKSFYKIHVLWACQKY